MTIALGKALESQVDALAGAPTERSALDDPSPSPGERYEQLKTGPCGFAGGAEGCLHGRQPGVDLRHCVRCINDDPFAQAHSESSGCIAMQAIVSLWQRQGGSGWDWSEPILRPRLSVWIRSEAPRATKT